MNKLLTKIVGLSLGLSMAIGVGVAVAATGVKNAEPAEATAGDVITFTININNVSAAGATWPTSYSTTQTTWSMTSGGVTISFGAANFTTGTGGNAGTMQNRTNNAGCSYLVSTGLTKGYAIKSVQGTSGTARNWDFYGATSTISVSNANPAVITGGTKVGNTNTDNSEHAFGSGTTYDSTNYPYTHFAMVRTGSNAGYYTAFTVKVVELEASTDVLTGVAVSGSMSKTSYYDNDSWNPSGLVVTATYNNDPSNTKNVTGNSTFTYFDSSDAEVATPNDLGIGTGQTLKVVATFDTMDSAKYSQTVNVAEHITYTLVTDATQLTAGSTFIIVSYNNTTPYVASSDASNGFAGGTNVTISGSSAVHVGAMVFTLSGTPGAWVIGIDSNKMAFTGSSNQAMTFTENPVEANTKFTITSSGNNVLINSNAQSGRGLRFNTGTSKFTNYDSGSQTAVQMYAVIAQSQYGTTDHIDVTAAPSRTSWHSGATFNSAGLTVVKVDENDNSELISTYSLSIGGTTITSGVTVFADSDIGSKTVTVTYTEDAHDFTDTFSIYVYAAATYELVTEAPANWAGSYLITCTIDVSTSAIDAGTYAFMSDLESFDISSNPIAVTVVGNQITTGQEFEWNVESYSTGYTVKGKSGKYVGSNTTSNGMSTYDSQSAAGALNTFAYDSENKESTIASNKGTYLTLSSASGQFRYYGAGSVQLYKLVESSEAAEYAATFLDIMSTGSSPVCVVTPQGEVQTDLDSLILAWGMLAEEFAGLSPADQQIFTQGSADTEGDDVNKTIACYEYVAAKYNTQLETETLLDYDFMDRGVEPLAGSKVVLSNLFDSSSASTVIIIVSVLSVSAIGGFFFLRKRKEQ